MPIKPGNIKPVIDGHSFAHWKQTASQLELLNSETVEIKPVAELTIEPVVEPVVEPATKLLAAPVVEPAVELVGEAASANGNGNGNGVNGNGVNGNGFGDRLRQVRHAAGLTLACVAAPIGVSPQAISSWEKGTHEPRLSHLVAVAELYGMTTDELLGGNTVAPTDAKLIDYFNLVGEDHWLEVGIAAAGKK
jgi:transcriptional regulator with XRE-family HTH domain